MHLHNPCPHPSGPGADACQPSLRLAICPMTPLPTCICSCSWCLMLLLPCLQLPLLLEYPLKQHPLPTQWPQQQLRLLTTCLPRRNCSRSRCLVRVEAPTGGSERGTGQLQVLQQLPGQRKVSTCLSC